MVCFHVLTCPSLCALQEVSVPCLLGCSPCPDLSLPSLVCFQVLTFPSFCTLQFVRASCLFDLFPCPYLFLPCALQLVSASHLLGLFHVLTYPTLCTLQRVSTPRSLGMCPCLDLSLLRSSGSECPSLTRPISVF